MSIGPQLGAQCIASCHSGFDISVAGPEEMPHDPLPALFWHVQKTGRERQSKALFYNYVNY